MSLQQSILAIKRAQEDMPDMMESYFAFTAKVQSTLTAKTKELILCSLAVQSLCHECIELHVQNAAATGATNDEILEAVMLAVVMRGGPAIMMLSTVYTILDDIS
jgi:AhpD family alkylhydroperoxidase